MLGNGRFNRKLHQGHELGCILPRLVISDLLTCTLEPGFFEAADV